jgi:hypothetical protein
MPALIVSLASIDVTVLMRLIGFLVRRIGRWLEWIVGRKDKARIVLKAGITKEGVQTMAETTNGVVDSATQSR